MSAKSLTIRRPDDWHVHLRDGDMLKLVAPFTARQFARAIVMPNLLPPVTSVASAQAYRERIVEATGPEFTPLMTCYLTDDSDPDQIASGFEGRVWVAAKSPFEAADGSLQSARISVVRDAVASNGRNVSDVVFVDDFLLDKAPARVTALIANFEAM